MRNLIARALSWVLSVLAPRRAGRHTAEYLNPHQPDPAPVSPWSRPWTAPSSREVGAVFRDERTLGLEPVERERRYAAALATLGVDYDFPTMPLGSIVRRTGAAT